MKNGCDSKHDVLETEALTAAKPGGREVHKGQANELNTDTYACSGIHSHDDQKVVGTATHLILNRATQPFSSLFTLYKTRTNTAASSDEELAPAGNISRRIFRCLWHTSRSLAQQCH